MLQKIYLTEGSGDNGFSSELFTDMYSNYSGQNTQRLAYASLVGNIKIMKQFLAKMKKIGAKLEISNTTYYVASREYVFNAYKKNNDIMHVVIKKKDFTTDNSNVAFIECPIFTKTQVTESFLGQSAYRNIPQEIIDATYEKILATTSVPMLKEWSTYVAQELARRYKYGCALLQIPCAEANVDYGFRSVYILSTGVKEIVDIISAGLKSKILSINGCNSMSEKLKDVSGLTSYLEGYGQILADKVTKKFVPKFNPVTESVSDSVNYYADVAAYHTDIIAYDVQKHVMEAISRNMDVNKHTILSGEMGTGKTSMGIGSVVAHARKKNYATIVMCPGNMVLNWQREIDRLAPFSESYIIENMNDLFAIQKRINDPKRKRALWAVITNGVVKSDYEVHPAANYDKRNDCFVCPKCGNHITGRKNHTPTGIVVKNGQTVYYGDMEMMQPDEYNLACKATIEETDPITGETVSSYICGERLWTAATKSNSKKWVKLNKSGWILKDHMQTVKKNCEALLRGMDAKAPKNIVTAYKTVIKSIVDHENAAAIVRVPRRYSIARYIRKHMKNNFDYAIFDEVHKLCGDSIQGKAFGDICNSVWRTLSMTGTLSNGYASGLFHLLFRTNSQRLIAEGYSYDSIDEFSEKYGVHEKIKVISATFAGKNRVDDQGHPLFESHGQTSRKRVAAGVSPLIFSNYLLDNSIFLFQKDITSDLVPYTEIPMGIDIDGELKDAHDEIMETLANCLSSSKYSKSYARNAVSYISMFLDQPFGLEGILDASGKEIVAPIELDDKVVRSKEQALIDLAIKKKANGEKMLIYCHWTNRLDIMNRLVDLLGNNDIKAEVMTSSVKQEVRQDWINNKAKDVDALIMNPKLIEVGLNLLDYTTIVFYEVGNELSCIRQASRRSWRLNQTKPVEVYFMYYNETVQEQVLAMTSSKLKASSAIEGNFTEDGLSAMTEDTDIMTKIADNIANNKSIGLSIGNFEKLGTEKGIQLRASRISNRLAPRKSVSYATMKQDKDIEIDLYAIA